MVAKKIFYSALISLNMQTPYSIMQWIRQKKYHAKLHIFNVLMPPDPGGYQDAQKTSDADTSDRSGESEEDLVQQTIGALKLKYTDTLNDSVRDFEFIVKVGSPDVEVIKYAKQIKAGAL